MFNDESERIPKPFYRERLPHYDPHDAPYFVTYRLFGSIPKSEIAELARRYRLLTKDGDPAEFFRYYDEILDRNGPYHLQQPDIRSTVMDSLHCLDRKDIHIYAFCVMPNHVHAVFNVLDRMKPLHNILQSHKRHTARQSNIVLDSTGKKFWAKESYDRVVREGRLGNAIFYTLNNPVKAGFVKHWRDWPGTYLSPDCYGFD